MSANFFLYFISPFLLALYTLIIPSTDTLDAKENLHTNFFQDFKTEFQNEAFCFYKQSDLFVIQEFKAEELKEEEERKNLLKKQNFSKKADLDGSEYKSLYIEKAISSANGDTSHFQQIPLYKLHHSWKAFLIFNT